METAVVLVRWVQYVTSFALAGGALFALYALPAAGPSSAAALGWPRRLLAGCAALLVLASFHTSAYASLAVLMAAMMALGAGNGAVFQLAPQRFSKEIGVITGLVGAMGGVGGFYLASTLGVAKQITGSYQAGFIGFAGLAVLALAALVALRSHWRARWPVLNTAPVRV